MYKEKFISAVIVAAGSSSRMNSSVSKQLMKLGDKTVIENTADKFRQCGFIDEIIVVCPAGDEELYRDLLGDGIVIVGGGAARQQSVYNGVSSASPDCDVIAVHDGARPLVNAEDIEKVIADGVRYGASTLAVHVKDTIKIVQDGVVADTPDRSALFAVQTPQVFYKNDYLKAYSQALSNGLEYTDDCQLIESVGGIVHITQGDYSNIKITTPEDIDVANALLGRRDIK